MNVQDWHPEDIKALIRKRGETLASLGRATGLSRKIVAIALNVPHAAAEVAIADFLNVPPQIIWPSRYLADGTRRRPQPAANYRHAPRFRVAG